MGLPGEAADFYRRSLAIDGNAHAAGELERLAPGTVATPPALVQNPSASSMPAVLAPRPAAMSTHWIDRLARIRAKTARQRGDAARDARDWPAAAEAYRAYLGMRPDHAAIWTQYGHALKESRRLDEALGAYEEAERVHGDNADLMLSLGHIHKLRGDAVARAAAYYEKSARQDSNAAAFGRAAATFPPPPPSRSPRSRALRRRPLRQRPHPSPSPRPSRPADHRANGRPGDGAGKAAGDGQRSVA